jgi:hypothetical protein
MTKICLRCEKEFEPEIANGSTSYVGNILCVECKEKWYVFWDKNHLWDKNHNRGQCENIWKRFLETKTNYKEKVLFT